MNDTERIKRITDKLAEAWKFRPDWRLCQFISNLHGTGPQDIFHTDDDDFEEGLDRFIKAHAIRNKK